jgi:hypothetical protein
VVIEAGLRGAFLLARGQPHGLMLIEDTPAGLARSFWAAAICLPGFLALRFLAWAETGGPPAGVAMGLAAELIGFVCAWAGFALASLPLARAQGREALWPHFVAAWNWTNVVQYVVMLVLALPASLFLPDWVGHGLGLATLGYAAWLEWFVAKSALRITGPQALGFVGLDLLLVIFLGGLVARMSGAAG